jgi:flagellar basal-body rod protein FlgF
MTSNIGLHPYARLGHLEALEGATIIERKLDTVANNMANVETIGFKKQGMTFEEYLLPSMHEVQRNAKGELETTDFSQGELRQTDNPMDFGIEGEGFFVVETPFGREYTRSGNFTLDDLNRLVTQEGYPVLGAGAPVTLEDTTGVGIWLSEDGRLFVDDTEAGVLDVVTFENLQALHRVGQNLFTSTEEAGQELPSEAKMRQGYLENSNVNPLETMTQLIDLYRAYEAQLKTLQAMDQMDSRAINDVGKLA